jgi:hypothetical protein
MLKSIARSSHFWAKIVGGTVSPPPLVRKTIIAAETGGSDHDCPARAPRAVGALTFPALKR